MFFDIGSNIGLWSLANINFTDKIIAIEASPITFNKLINNINNNLIECLNYAVSNSDEEYIDFYHTEWDTISTLNIEWIKSEKSRFYNSCNYTVIKCKTIKLDDLIEKYGVPELIKIDVECAEYECITSLTKKVNQICFEWSSEFNDINFKCIDYLYNLGYNKFYIQYKDDYCFRPNEYYDIEYIKNELLKTIPKNDFGMIWCI